MRVSRALVFSTTLFHGGPRQESGRLGAKQSVSREGVRYMGTYSFDASWSEERKRLASIEITWDPFTIRHLEELGVAPGWRCLEVGGGGGSIVRWLCERVGPNGSATATDLDTRFLDEIGAGNLEVLRHDVASEALPEDAFD